MNKLFFSLFLMLTTLCSDAQLTRKQPKGFVIKDTIMVEDIRIAVMATGHFDHSGFSTPKWVTSKWSDQLWRNENGERCRKRKAVIVITAPKATDDSIVYFWLVQVQGKEDKKWYVSKAIIIW
jgi:hypothetical protein